MKPPRTHFNDPHPAARAALARYGWSPPPQAIADIVTAVYTATDGIADRRMDVTPHAWAQSVGDVLPRLVRQDMRRDLALYLDDHGYLPVDLPKEHRTFAYLTHPATSDDLDPDAWQHEDTIIDDDWSDQKIGQVALDMLTRHPSSLVIRLRLWVPYRVPGRWTA